MIETKNLILDKAKFTDWQDMYRNVWSRPESARYMMWKVTTSEEDAQIRIQKTMEFQKSHDTYLVYEKKSGAAIGFAGVEKLSPRVYQEAGICLGPDFVGKGYGKEILAGLIQYCVKEFNAVEFHYSTRAENQASKKLAASFGFVLTGREPKVDDRDGHEYVQLNYRLPLG